MSWLNLNRLLHFIDRNTFKKFLDFDTYYKVHSKTCFFMLRLGFRLKNGYFPNLKNPVSFNEKVLYRNLFDKNPLYPVIVDKYKVRKYVEEKIGNQHLIPLLQIADSPDKVDFDAVPESFVIKMTHASGQNIFIRDRNYNVEEIKRQLHEWSREKYRYESLIGFVQPIKRRIIIEKLLIDEEGKIPKDYKFFVFGGKVRLVQVDYDRFSGHTRTLYDQDWNPQDTELAFPKGEITEQPKTFEEMKKIAEKLGEDFDFMRVDLYTINDDIFFGELTPCPGAGRDRFRPTCYDLELGQFWK